MGQTVKTQAIVILKTDYKEADRIITLFSPELGKISACARGVKKQNSKLRSASEMFVFGDFLLTESRSRYTVTGFDLVYDFSFLRTDFEKLSAAALMTDMCARTLKENEKNTDLFTLLLRSLGALEKQSTAFVLTVYLLKFCTAIGYMPQFLHCCACGSKSELVSFDFASGGMLCLKCMAKTEHIVISKPCLELLAKINEMTAEKALDMTPPDEKATREAYLACCRYTAYHLDEKIRIMDYITKYGLI